MPRWRVDIIRKCAERLGTIEAANEKEAIEKAAKEFDIPPERQNRIVAKISASSLRPSRQLSLDQNFDTNRTVDRVVPCLTTLGRLPRPPFFLDGTVIVASRRLL
jgi:hypothetical protein